MELMQVIERIGVPLFFCLILIKSQQEKDKQMLKANEKLLETNDQLGKTIKSIVTDITSDIKETKNNVLHIVDILKKEDK